MNKKITGLVIVILLLTTKLFAIPVVTVSYHKGCFLGCGDVNVEKHLVSYSLPDGSNFQVWERSVNCTGFGFYGCPSSAYPAGEATPENWLDNISIQMFDFAMNQLSNGNLSGVHTTTFYNTETGETAYLKVEWNRTLDNEGNPISEDVTVTKLDE